MMKSKALVLVVVISIFIMILAVAAGVTVHDGSAKAGVSELTVTQSAKVTYCGLSYVDADGLFVDMGQDVFHNDLYSALSFYLDGVKIDVDHADIVFTDLTFASRPDSYKGTASIDYLGENYTVSINFTISKRTLIVRALINGQTSVTIKEGENYTTSIEYEGFVGYDNESVLTAPAIITKEPKMPTTGYNIVPEYAESNLYEFDYQAARIVITENPDPRRVIYEGEVPSLILTGSFSPYYTLEYVDIGVNKASSDYVAINEKVERYYGNGGLFDKYEKSDVFTINMYLDGEYAELNDPITVQLKLDAKKSGKSEYMLIQFAPDGSNNIISASEENGYLVFRTVDLGEYVLLTPIEGVNKVVIIGIIAGIIGVAALGIIFGSLFRRKY